MLFCTNTCEPLWSASHAVAEKAYHVLSLDSAPPPVSSHSHILTPVPAVAKVRGIVSAAAVQVQLLLQVHLHMPSWAPHLMCPLTPRDLSLAHRHTGHTTYSDCNLLFVQLNARISCSYSTPFPGENLELMFFGGNPVSFFVEYFFRRPLHRHVS